MRELKISRTTETRSICPYCAVSCGVIIHTLGDKAKNVSPSVVHVEGDPDPPINHGTLCPKGATLKADINNPSRLTSPKVRRPGSDKWEEISWDQAIARSRATSRTPATAPSWPRTPRARRSTARRASAMIGGCTDTNENNYLQWKFITCDGNSLPGTQARI